MAGKSRYLNQGQLDCVKKVLDDRKGGKYRMILFLFFFSKHTLAWPP